MTQIKHLWLFYNDYYSRTMCKNKFCVKKIFTRIYLISYQMFRHIFSLDFGVHGYVSLRQDTPSPNCGLLKISHAKI